MSGRVVTARNGFVTTVVIDQPARRNAVSAAMLRELAQALSPEALADARVVLLRGAGDRAFCAGFDVAALPESGSDGRAFDAASAVNDAAQAIAECPLPVVALLCGACYGAGGELAAAADIRVAADDLQFAMPPAKLGLVYAERGLERFRQLVGPAATAELFFAAAPVDAARAYAMGLVQRVLPKDAAAGGAEALAATIAANAPLSLRHTKTILRRLAQRGGVHADDVAEFARLRLAAFQSDDYREGLMAMLEKRPPAFRGR